MYQREGCRRTGRHKMPRHMYSPSRASRLGRLAALAARRPARGAAFSPEEDLAILECCARPSNNVLIGANKGNVLEVFRWKKDLLHSSRGRLR
jgi:hypothetical protein